MTRAAQSTARPERADARANREKLLAAARSLLAERGFEAEITEIAARAGLGVGTVYRNFPTREALIEAIINEVNLAMLREVERMRRIPDAQEALAHGIRAGYRLVDQYGALLLTLIAGAAPAPLAATFQEARIRDALDAIFRSGIADGSLPAGLDLEFAAAMLEALFAPRPLQRLLQLRTTDEAAEAATEFFLAGLQGLSAGRSPQGAG